VAKARVKLSAIETPWDVIRANALAFSKHWEGAGSEKTDSQTFCNEFFAKDVYKFKTNGKQDACLTFRAVALSRFLRASP
jgi:hypothetical protein